MNKTLVISAISLIAVVLVIGVSPAMANNGSNGCENANPNAKSCESSPNAEPIEYTCLYCIEELWDDHLACVENYTTVENYSRCESTALSDFRHCNDVVERNSDEICHDVPPWGL